MALLLVAAAMTAPGARAAGCDDIRVNGAWRTIPLPEQHATVLVDPSGPGRLFAASGPALNRTGETDSPGSSVVYQSTDGGCSWHVVFHTSDVARLLGAGADPHDVEYAIVQMVVPDGHEALGKQHVYLLLAPSVSSLYTPVASDVVVVSADGGRTWTANAPALGDTDLHGRQCGSNRTYANLAVAPSDPRVAYLLCVQYSGITGPWENHVYQQTGTNPLFCRITWFATADSGRTWSVAARVEDGHVDTSDDYYYAKVMGDALVDPYDPKSVWVTVTREFPRKGGGFSRTVNVKHSTDGARTFREVASFPSLRGFYFVDSLSAGMAISRPKPSARATLLLWNSFSDQVDAHPPTDAGHTERVGWMAYSTNAGRSWRQWDASPMFGSLSSVTGGALPVPGTAFAVVSRADQTACGRPVQSAVSIDLRTGRVRSREAPTTPPDLVTGATRGLASTTSAARPVILTAAETYPKEQACAEGSGSQTPSTTVLLQYTGPV